MPVINLQPQLNEIIAADLPEIEKLSKAYNFLITEHINISRREIELLRVIGDKEVLVKEQIKLNTMEYALGVFHDCHQLATGRKVSNE